MSVIGFDIGNESCVIASAKRGGVDVLLNDGSKRETPAVVSFCDKQRFMGSAGAAFATANPKSTISQIKRLIGKLYKEVEEDLKLLPFTTIEGPRGGILIELEYLKTKWTFTPVEILGMLFKHLKQVTEKSLESSVYDCVIGIPSYFSDLQRRMYLDAARIAGLNPLRLMHEGTAIALGYGMYKTDLSNSRPTIAMFVDIGHCDTQVTVAAFQQGRMKILSHSFDQNLGGRDFDEVLFKHFAAQFNEKHKINVYSNARASVRLMASCEKVKKVLSVNAEAPLSIECLIGDTDVSGIITREEFENLSSELLDKVPGCCKRALKDAGLTVEKIYTVELVGSGSRIPAITRVLNTFFGKEPTRTLNASECVARGCALRCAMLSPNLQVRDYEVEDSLPYSVVISLAQGKTMVFPKGTSFPNEKILHHSVQIPCYLQVAYGKSKVFPAGISHIVGQFGIGSSEQSHAEVKVKFKLKLSHHGIVELDSAKIFEDKHNFGANLWQRVAPNNYMRNLHASENLDSVKNLEDKRYSNPLKMLTPDNHTRNLLVSENVDVSITNDELVEATDKERILTEQDIKVEEIKDQRNTLESFVYDTRSKLSGAYKSFATDSDKEVIINKLQETEDWLYEDSDDESEQDYNGRLEHLIKLVEPIENKYNEERALTKARKALQSSIQKYRSDADSLKADKKEKVKSECIEVERSINTISQKESSPKIVSTAIYRAIETFEKKCKSIIRSKPSLPRYEEPVDHENAMAKAAKPLLDCIAHYDSLAESLPADKKEKVKNSCIDAQKFLSGLSQKHSSSKTLSTEINRAKGILESNCKIIISNQADFENLKTEETKALEACIAKHRSQAESLPASMKDKVNDVCFEAQQMLIDALSEKHTSPNTLNNLFNDVIKDVERKYKSIITGHEEPEPENWYQWEQPVYTDGRDQPVDSTQRDQPMDTYQVEQMIDSNQRVQPMDTDEVDQSVDSDQRNPLHDLLFPY